MKRKILSSIIFLAILWSCGNNEKITHKIEPGAVMTNADGKKADSVLALMTLDEKIAYIGGDRIFFIRPIERLGLPEVYFTDATQGIHIRQGFKDNHTSIEYDLTKYAMEKSTAFPSPIALASTWNKNLSKQYANAVGEECLAGGIGVLLGPGMNIYRNSQCGRNFEYFGEDPFLAAKMIENYVTGVQSTGTVATLKHFVANNTDFFRRKSNSVVDERTLHEIYMPAFKAGIDAGAKAVMTSYNLLNGEWCGQSDYVINNLLKNQLGFTGLVMTDWWSVDDGEKLAKSGMDLEMPYTIALENAKELLAEGKIEEKDIDRMVKSILKMCFEMGLYDRKPNSELYLKFPEHVTTALNVARESIVMLKNQNSILPIKTSVNNILITGQYVKELLLGGGSGTVDGYEVVTMLKAITDEFGAKVKFIEDPSMKEIQKADIVLCNVGTQDSEGYDRPFELPIDQENLVQKCVENNANTVVIVTSGSGIKMTYWDNKAAAILYTWYAGQIGNVAIAEILSGKINPSGKLPMTIEKDFKDSPAYGYNMDEELYVGWNSDGEKAHAVYDVNYDEGVFVGYRWFENKNIEPLYSFGHGLSFSTFDITNISFSNLKMKADGQIIVSVSITNNSEVSGKEVIQLYIGDDEASVERPIKELKGFEKIELNPRESKIVKFIITSKELSFWNPQTKGWFAEKGKFKLHVGTSSKNINQVLEFELI